MMDKEKLENKEGFLDIDLKDIYNFILRNKKILSIFLVSSFIIGTINAFRAKKIWEGEFQIVLDKNDSSNSSPFAGFEGITFLGNLTKNNKSALQTEVKILESPLILSDVFKFIKQSKSLSNKEDLSNLTFKKWKENSLDIELEKGTSVLNLKYRDNKKEIIIPVLKKISQKYQTYSNQSRVRQIELSADFYEKQIADYKKKSLESLKNLEEFANEHNLLSIQILDKREFNNEMLKDINIEAKRIYNKNQIQVLESLSKKIDNLKSNEDLLFFAKNFKDLPSFSAQQSSLTAQIQAVDNEIFLKKLIYQDTDKIITDLIKQRDALYDILRKQIFGYLNAQKEIAYSEIKATERPEGVFVKYKQLISETLRDRKVLTNLEDQYRGVLLDQAKIEDPWKLITEPTVLNYPVAPSKKRIVLLHLIIGGLIGFSYCNFKDKYFKKFSISKQN